MAESNNKKKNGRGPLMTIAVAVFSITMVVAMLLPSLSLIFGGTQKDQTPKTVAEADAQYQPQADELNKKLEANDKDLDALSTLGFTYYAWAGQVEQLSYSSISTGSEDATTALADNQAHAQELYRNARDAFDRYLAIQDDARVHEARIMCSYYLNEDGAVDEMAAYAEQSGSATAWADLGMMRMGAGESELAKEAFNKAVEADPNDAQGAKSYAEQYLSYLQQLEDLQKQAETAAAATTAAATTAATSATSADAASTTTTEGESASK